VLGTTICLWYFVEMLRSIKFDWDQWNIQKNEIKHGVSQLEAESAFYDPEYKLFQDFKHSSKKEKRYILYAKSLENRILMIGFTIREKRFRIITARSASKKERKIYGKKT
jgi:hypothetical protein